MDELELNELGWTQRPTRRQVLVGVMLPVVCSLLIAGAVGFATLLVAGWTLHSDGVLRWSPLALILLPAIAGLLTYLCLTVTFDRSRPTGVFWRLR